MTATTTPTFIASPIERNPSLAFLYCSIAIIIKTTEIAVATNQVRIPIKVLSVYKRSVTYNTTLKATEASPNKSPFLSTILKKFTFFVSISKSIFKVNYLLVHFKSCSFQGFPIIRVSYSY